MVTRREHHRVRQRGSAGHRGRDDPAAGGALRSLREFGIGDADDWQPCPHGVCPKFARKYPPNLSVAATLDSSTVTARGVLADSSFLGQHVGVTLKRWSHGRYAQVGRSSTTVGPRGHYTAAFTRPAAGKCRVVTRYAGEEFFYLPSRAHHDFAC